jgi:hypothetical protein
MRRDGLSIVKKLPVFAAVKIGFCRNWTVQDNIVSAVLPEHKAMFAQQYITRKASDATTKGLYKLDEEPLTKQTLLLREQDAADEASRLLNIYSMPRYIYSHTGYMDLMEIEIGDEVFLQYDRFGLQAGKAGFVVRKEVNDLRETVKLGVLA